MRYVTGNTPEKLWQKLTGLQQDNLASYSAYEAQFLKLWTEWEASLNEGERAPNFLQKERFLAGLNALLQEKVRAKFPETFEEARQVARAKDRKLQFQASRARREIQPPHNEQPPQPQPHQAVQTAPTSTDDLHLELLQRETTKLDDLFINLVQGPQGPPPPRHEAPQQ